MQQEALGEICSVLGKLNTSVFLLEGNGKCLFPRQPETFRLPDSLAVDVCQAQNGYLYLLLPGLSGEVLAVKDSPGAADFLRLTAAMIQATKQTHGVGTGLDSDLKRLLLGRLAPAEQSALTKQYGMAESAPRCVMLLTLEKVVPEGARAMLESLLPVQEDDRLIATDQHTAALIRDMRDVGLEEMGEFAAALQDTLINELGQQAVIGIGETVQTLASLPLSYEQATSVLLLSRVYPQESGIYEHHRLLMERFLMQTPEDIAMRYYPMIFNRKTAKLLSEDMLKTITVFFDKNLNLSDASRELYIHRNTLVYRLDKVQKQLGLDLRRFHDAMTFKLLLDLHKRASALPGISMNAPGKGNP